MTQYPPRRQRRLSEAERVLWGEVTRGIAPLRLRPGVSGGNDLDRAAAELETAKPKQTAISPVGASKTTRMAETAAKAPPPLAPIGRRVRQRLGRSRGEIAGRIDLHGLTQREAHDALLRFLRNAQVRGAGIVLVITGKGRADGERGVLRRQVPHWLRLPDFRALIVGFETAHAAHGGEGALYVQVRRRRD